MSTIRTHVLVALAALALLAPLGCDSDGGSDGDATVMADGSTAADSTDVGPSDTTTATTTTTAADATDPGDTETSTDAGDATEPGDTDPGDTATPGDMSGPGDTAAPPDLADMTGLPAGPSSGRHTAHAIGTKYAEQGFWEYLPEGYGNGNAWPIIIFFHGLGENGDGSANALGQLTNGGPPRYISRDEWPIAASATGDAFIVLSPQNSKGDCHKPADIDAFVRWAAAEYDVDETRIYLTGLSCGAIGLWGYLRNFLDEDLVAAVVPIAGNGNGAWNEHGCDLGVMPIWAFHGDMDNTVGVGGTNNPMDGLAACTDPEPVDAIKTLYPGVGHNSWSRTYDLSAGHDIYTWFLGHDNPDVVLP